MKNNRLVFGRLIFGLAFLMCSIGGVQAANSISLNAVSSPVTVGSQATFELWMDFTGDPTLGGGVDVVFDNFINGNQLSFNSYNPEALGDSDLINIPVVSASGDRLEGITFGDLTNGLEGPALVGTLLFDTLVAGNYSLSPVNSDVAGGFFSISGAEQFPVYNSASLTVDPVPVPAAIWLMLSGLGGLSGMAFRQKAKRPG